MALARSRGFALSAGEMQSGVISMSAPVVAPDRGVEAVVTLPGLGDLQHGGAGRLADRGTVPRERQLLLALGQHEHGEVEGDIGEPGRPAEARSQSGWGMIPSGSAGPLPARPTTPTLRQPCRACGMSSLELISHAKGTLPGRCGSRTVTLGSELGAHRAATGTTRP
ncbi:hypothetical protein [Spongiactinospora sp. TRM90649]|uniref:hypothetical protein n=1 Tax=Spongiactinospora sp. TRM90649 TaxID=3031114 RepID=UPI0023F722BA|nr:hypothetical protein [Spongiactinospora sp. TRM90649]MDF5757461.1 hypothetical protein [Spongiactinospora sp. TRM90649]